MKYRSDINGLRAFAIIPVLLFHAQISVFAGGYVGVDIFFVISGYLITTLIMEEISADKFNIINFYTRRIKRIFPVLFFVSFITFVVFSFFAVPFPFFKDIAESLVSTVLSVSNILFWIRSGYFDVSAEMKLPVSAYPDSGIGNIRTPYRSSDTFDSKVTFF